MQSQRALAIILKTVPYQERHRMITALTENHGLVSAIAQNCIQSRRFGGTLDLFTASEWLYTEKPGSDLWYLQEAQIRKSFDGLHGNFEKLSLASTLNETALRAAPHQASDQAHASELFKLHSNALVSIEEMPDLQLKPTEILLILDTYFAKVLQWSGYQPQMQECMNCQKPLHEIRAGELITCLIAEGGWICEECRIETTRHLAGVSHAGSLHRRVSPWVIQLFYRLVEIPIRKVVNEVQASEPDLRSLFSFLEALMIFHIPGFDEKPFKSMRFLNLESNLSLPRSNLR